MTIGVVVIEDSPTMGRLLARLLEAEGDIGVLAIARDGAEARAAIRALEPDVVSLDIEMPGMNGLDFLDRLMRLHPLPVVMVSNLTEPGSSESLLALELGAVDVLPKSAMAGPGGSAAFGIALREKVRLASKANVRAARNRLVRAPLATAVGPGGALVAIGASTGGVDAIGAVLAALPADCPPVLIAQHMPAGFTTRFAARLDEVSALSVTEAGDGQPLRCGHAYLAPGDRHLLAVMRAGVPMARVTDEPPLAGYRPSVDGLFASVARVAGPLAVGVILTGMGRDGASGLAAIRAAGGRTLGQSPASCLVYGMPRVAFEEGAVETQLPLHDMAEGIARALAAAGRVGQAAI